MFGFLSRGNTGYADPLDFPENHPAEVRRSEFGMTQGPAGGKPEPIEYYIPGELDAMAAEGNIASDDPYQLEAKLQAWKSFGYPERDEKDQRRLKEFLER